MCLQVKFANFYLYKSSLLLIIVSFSPYLFQLEVSHCAISPREDGVFILYNTLVIKPVETVTNLFANISMKNKD